MAGQEGFEPPTSGFGIRRSASWSYWPAKQRVITLFLTFGMRSMRTTGPTELLDLELGRTALHPFAGPVITVFAFCAFQCHIRSCSCLFLCHVTSSAFQQLLPSRCTAFEAVPPVEGSTISLLFTRRYSIISATTPAPTVRPPSRIAKSSSFSMAMGIISSTSISALSPGIHMSLPTSFAVPVTSVVLK